MFSSNRVRIIKETAKLEAENFVQLQKVTLASELKSVLDSWVRYEQQVKEREQAELTKSVIDKVLASLKDEKVQKEILQNAVAEVERTSYIPSFLYQALFNDFCVTTELVKSKAI